MIKWLMCFVICFLLVSIAWLGSPLGINRAIRIIEWASSGQLLIQGVHGSLFGHLDIDHIHYNNPKFSMKIQKLDWRWRPGSLWHGEWSIQYFRVKKLVINLKGLTKHSPSNRMTLKIPTAMIIEQASIQELILNDESTKKCYIAHSLLAQIEITHSKLHIKASLSTLQPMLSRWQFYLRGSDQQYHLHLLGTSRLFHADIQGHGNRLQTHFRIQPSSILKGQVRGDLIWHWQSMAMSQIHLAFSHISIKHQQFSGVIDGRYHDIQHFSVQARLFSQLGLVTLKGQRHQVWQMHAHARLLALNKLWPSVPITGTASGDFQLTGEQRWPRIKGHVDFHQVTITLSPLSLSLKPDRLQLETQGQRLNYQWPIHIQHHVVNIRGSVPLNIRPWQSELKLSGVNVPLVHTLEYQADASFWLHLRYQKERFFIHGQIMIPKASIRKPNLASVQTLPKADIQFVHSGKKPSKAWSYSAHVQLRLGQDIHLNAYGIQGKITGQIQLNKPLNKPLMANGQLQLIHSTYSAYGQLLRITRGELNYAYTPLFNPNINISAIKGFDIKTDSGFNHLNGSQLIIGIRVLGSLSHPNIRLFSKPATLNETDMLAYLVLGRPLGLISPSTLLLQATRAWQGSNSLFNGMIHSLEKSLNLNELGVKSQTQLDALGHPISVQNQFVMGKYLTPNIYLRYSRDWVNATNTFKLRYFFNPQWSIQTETNSLANGVDVLYSFALGD